jgi:hypothetical protein
MSRKTTTRNVKPPLTGADLAKMDSEYELKKAALIKDRGVTAPVTPVIKTSMAEVMEACDFAQDVGVRIGRQQGLHEGMKAPRTAAEQRVIDQTPALARILQEVFVESRKAIGKHPAQHSPHEGYAVLQEEVDELWDEIKADRGRQASARTEAVQVAAMAVRYILDNDPH